MKQIIITLIAWTTIVLSVSATGQEGEQLFWKGANYQMLTCPLYDCHAFDNLGKKLEEEMLFHLPMAWLHRPLGDRKRNALPQFYLDGEGRKNSPQ